MASTDVGWALLRACSLGACLLRGALAVGLLLAASMPARAQGADAGANGEAGTAAPIIRPGGNEAGWAAKQNPGGVGLTGVDAAGFASRTFGVRPFVADGTSGPGRSTMGVVARERATGLLLAPWISARYGDELWLGYDGVDFTGRAALDVAVGLFVPVTSFTGPVVRLGLYAEAMQLTGFSKAELRLGSGELGWTYARGPVHLDLVFQLGPTLLGEVNFGPTHRGLGLGLGSVTWGTYLSSGWEELTLDFRINQIGLDSASGPVTDLRAEVCGLLGGRPARPTKTTRGKNARAFVGPHGRDFRTLVCADVSHGYASDGLGGVAPGLPAALSSRWTSIGISILIGRASRLDPLPRVGL